MSAASSQPSRDDVLDAFSVEPDHDRRTLETYLTRYPQFARDLVDLARELSRTFVEDERPLSDEDKRLIGNALEAHRFVALGEAGDPFAGLETGRLREIARQLDVPRQVIAAFRERRIRLSSVPRRFLGRLAAALDVTVDKLVGGLLGSPVPAGARSYKSDGRPGNDGLATFEQVLIDAEVGGERLEALMSEDA